MRARARAPLRSLPRAPSPQIYNPTSAAVDLTGYSLASCTNGCSSDGVFEYGYNYPTGATIAAGGTYTVCNSGMEGNTSTCDEVLSYPQVSFNGDDFQALISSADYTTATSADIVDQIGLFSTTDPGSNWPVCGTSSGLDTQNGLLLRATDTCCGDSTGAAFEDSFTGTCEWTETTQYTTPYVWTSTGSCSSVVCAPSPTASPTFSAAPVPQPTAAPTPAPQPTVAPTVGLFFSQFQEASSGNNKYFQIYNPTDAEIDLAGGYSFCRCSNGCASDGVCEYGNTFAANATIAAGGTYTICNSGLEGNTSTCDEILSDYLVYFNGDDFVSLITGTDYTTATSADIVDQIGLFSATDPGTSWPVCGTSSGFDTRNGLLIRANTTCGGDSTGAAFEDSFNGDCPWIEVEQYTTPYVWTAAGTCAAAAGPTCALRADTWYYSCSYYSSYCSSWHVFGGSYAGECDTTCGLYSTCTDSTYATCTASDYDGCAPTAAPTTYLPTYSPSISPTFEPTVTPVPSPVPTGPRPTLLDCDFDSSDMCGMTNGDLAWTWNYGTTPSGSTGPSGDHTSGSGYYMFVEATGNSYAGPYTLTSPFFSGADGCVGEVTFAYHMYGGYMGSLDLEASLNGVDWTTFWTKSGDQGDSWQMASATAPTNLLQVRLSGTVGGSYTSDLAIDDLVVFADTTCTPPSPAPTITIAPTSKPTVTPTPAPSVTPYFMCPFEGSSCGLDYGYGTSYEWTFQMGSTPSSGTGPSGDYTTGSGYYMFVESSTPNNPNVGPYTLTTPQFPVCVGEVNFAYHMYGSTMGTLVLEETLNGIDWAPIWNMTGDQGDSWHYARVTASSFVIQVRWAATTGSSWQSDMAIDNVFIFDDDTCYLPTPSPTATFRPTPIPSSIPTPSPTATPLPTTPPTPVPTGLPYIAFETTGPCILSANDTCVSSGNYPASYGNNEDCEITPFSKGVLSVVSFSTESYWDYMTIDGVTYDGTAGPDGLEVTRATSISWYSDSSVQYGGWKICLEGFSPSPVPTVTPVPTVSFLPTPAPSSSSPTATRPQIEITGSCTYAYFLDDVYAPVTTTASGAVYYEGVYYGMYLFYEPDCSGDGSFSPMWKLDNSEPSTTAAGDLDGDGACSLWAYTYSTAMEPPSGLWNMYCGYWASVTLTLAPARIPVVNTQVGMSGLNCSGFSATIFNTALDMLVPNSTFSDSLCADTGTMSIEVTTEVTTPRIYIVHGTNLQEHVTHLLNESIYTGTFESTIQALATSSRRLGATSSEAHRRLTAAMASASVDSVTASTFAPSAAPTPAPSQAPTPAPTALPTISFSPTSVPTAVPIPVPTATPIITSSPTASPTDSVATSSSASTNELALALGIGAFLLLGGGALAIMFMQASSPFFPRAQQPGALQSAATACF